MDTSESMIVHIEIIINISIAVILFVVLFHVASRAFPLVKDSVDQNRLDKMFYSSFPLRNTTLSRNQRTMLKGRIYYSLLSKSEKRYMYKELDQTRVTDLHVINSLVFSILLKNREYTWGKKIALRRLHISSKDQKEILETARLCAEEMATEVCGTYDTTKLYAKWSKSGQYSVWIKWDPSYVVLSIKDSRGRNVRHVRKSDQNKLYTDVFAYIDVIQRLTN